jgi:glycosyltransferase involved in cell wall biosynthesis
MNLIVSLEHHFSRTPDGAVWTQTQFPYKFWTRYLAVFDQVQVVARVRDVAVIPEDWQSADGQGVSFAAVPHYQGPWQYLRRARQVRQAVSSAVGPRDAVILRVSSNIAAGIAAGLYKTGHPYGVEVVSDPYDVFAPGAVRNPLRPFFRWWFPHQLRQHCMQACAAAYVTEHALQRRYPCPSYSIGVSDVDLPNEAIVAAPRPPWSGAGPQTLIYVGTLAQLYKAPDVLIDAVGACVREGLDLRLVVVGDGRYRAELEARAAMLGLKEHVQFCGQLTAGAAVRSKMDQSNLFVLPSRQEGMPRAMIEAMARGLPCIGSTVGGIPELLPPEDMVPPGDVAGLARKIREVVGDPQRMTGMAIRNLERARTYSELTLHERRIAFYRHVRAETEAWLRVGERSARSQAMVR